MRRETSWGESLSTGPAISPAAACNEAVPAATAGELRFEYAARLRDEIAELKRELKGCRSSGV